MQLLLSALGKRIYLSLKRGFHTIVCFKYNKIKRIVKEEIRHPAPVFVEL